MRQNDHPFDIYYAKKTTGLKQVIMKTADKPPQADDIYGIIESSMFLDKT